METCGEGDQMQKSVLIGITDMQAKGLPDEMASCAVSVELARIGSAHDPIRSADLSKVVRQFTRLERLHEMPDSAAIEAPLLTFDMAETIARHGQVVSIEGTIFLISDERGLWFTHPLIERMFIGAALPPSSASAHSDHQVISHHEFEQSSWQIPQRQ